MAKHIQPRRILSWSTAVWLLWGALPADAASPDELKVQILPPESNDPAQKNLEYLELPKKKKREVRAISATEIIQPILDVAKKAVVRTKVAVEVKNEKEINEAKNLAETPPAAQVDFEVKRELDFSEVTKLEWSVAARALAEIPKYTLTSVAVEDQFQVPTYGTVCFELAGMFGERAKDAQKRGEMKVPAAELMALDIEDVGDDRRYWVVAEGEKRTVFDGNQFSVTTKPLMSVRWDKPLRNALRSGQSTDQCVLTLALARREATEHTNANLTLPRETPKKRFSAIRVYASEPGATLLGKASIRGRK